MAAVVTGDHVHVSGDGSARSLWSAPIGHGTIGSFTVVGEMPLVRQDHRMLAL